MRLTFHVFFTLAFALFVGVSTSAQTPPDIDKFFPKLSFGEPTLSPSGKYLAMPDYSDDEHKIVIINVDSQKAIYSHKMGDLKVNWVQWATDERILFSLTFGHDQRLSARWYTRDEDGKVTRDVTVTYSRVMAMNIDASEQMPMFSNANNKVKKNQSLSRITDVLPNDPDHILMPAVMSSLTLWKVNIHTGEATKIEKGDKKTRAWKTNKNGIPVVRFDRFGWGSSARIKVYMRAPGEKKWEKVATVRQKDLQKFNPIAQTNDPSIYYVSARPDGYDRAAIFKYDLNSKTFLEPVSSNDHVDLYNAIVDDGGEYVGSIYFEDKLEYDFLDDTRNAHMQGLDNFFGNENNILISDISANGRLWLLYVYGPREPGSYYSYDTQVKRTEFLFSENQELDESDLGKIEIINYVARDGQKLRGYLTSPARPRSSPPPLIVMPHGGPQLRDYYGYDSMAQFYTTRGYQVFQPNFRGSKGFGDKFEHAGYKKWGTIMIDDITDGTLHLIETGKVDKNRICIVGASYGGYAAYMSAIKQPNLYQCAVSMSGVSDLMNTIKFDLKKFKDADETTDYLKESIGHPKKDKDLLFAQSPISHVSTIQIPMLIIHGDKDNVVPVEQSRAMHAALLAAGKSSKYFEYKNTDHSLFGVDPDDEDAIDDNFMRKKSLQDVERFLAEHLAP